jgi:hypothetical protein
MRKTALEQLEILLKEILGVSENMAKEKSPDTSDQLLGQHGIGIISGIIVQLDKFKECETDNLRHAYNHSCTDKSFEEYYKEAYDKQDTK